MKKLLSCVALIMTMALLTGCEWTGSGSGSSWSDSYSWANFAGVYRPIAGQEYLVQKSGTSTNTPGSVIETTQSLGAGDSNQATFNGTLQNLTITLGSVVVRAGSWSMTDSNGDGNLTGAEGAGTINYSTGVITVNWNNAPGNGVNVIVTYNYAIAGTGGNPTGPTPDVKIYTMTVSQTGQHIDIIDSNGVRYSGEMTSLSNTGGDKTGNTSGEIVANFSAKTDTGIELVGVFNGVYTSPQDNSSSSAQYIGNKADTSTGASIVTTGVLANRQMQGTYIGTDGSTGDILGEAGSISVTVTN